MKKIAKVITGVALLTALSATATVLGACGEKETTATGEAYGLVHGAGYIGYAKVTVTGDNIDDVVLKEVCLPTHITAPESVAAADKVTGTVSDHGEIVQSDYYKTVSFGGVTATYDATIPEGATTSKGYMVGNQTLLKYLETEVNAKAYFDAVITNSVTVNGGDKTVMTNKALNKEENGYWERTDKNGAKYSRWKANRDATVSYVKSNGVGNLKNLVLSSTATADKYEDKEVKYWMDGNISTGATWADLNKSGASGYYTYAALITKAYDQKN